MAHSLSNNFIAQINKCGFTTLSLFARRPRVAEALAEAQALAKVGSLFLSQFLKYN